MPYAPPSLCTKGCGTLVYSGGQCPTCLTETRRERDRTRPNGYQRGYTREWATFSKDYLARHWWCQSPTHQDHAAPRATDVDHTGGHSRTCPHAYNEQHLQALCHSCHARKTATDDGGLGTTRTPRCQ
jgi:5-methylcytosine-specific restriction protein A